VSSSSSTSAPSSPRPLWRRLWRRLWPDEHPLFGPLLTLGLMLLLNALVNPTLLHLQWRDGHLYGTLVDVINRAAPLAMVALGMTLVVALRGIDISVGAVVAIAGAVAALMIGGQLEVVNGQAVHVSRVPMGVALLGALGVAALCGLWNGVLVAGIGMQPIIATLILMVAGRGVAQLLTGGQIITVYHAPFFVLGSGYWLGLPVAAFIALALWGLLQSLCSLTALGLCVRAVGVNPEAARVAGLRSGALMVAVYTVCGVCAGLAGLVIASNVKSADGNNAGQLMELDAILAVTLGGNSLNGGRFSLAGSLVGALIIQTLTSTIYTLGVPPEINLVVKAAVVVVVMLVQSADFRREIRNLVFRPPVLAVAEASPAGVAR
jgi:galactofuranose transport system permease protein